MNFISVPNLPDGPVKLAVVDGRISREIENNLTDAGICLIKTRQHTGVYEAVSFHPDMIIHHVSYNNIVYAPGTDAAFLGELDAFGFRLIEGATRLSPKYPGDIAYNVARIGKYAMHNLKYTDPVLKSALLKQNVELMHVNQGYAKCSVSVVNAGCIITADKGIAKAAETVGIEVLLIEPGENILLEGLDQGFIGGSTGLLNKNLWAVTGEIRSLKSACKIRDFLYNKGIEILCLSKNMVVDAGSIIPLLTK